MSENVPPPPPKRPGNLNMYYVSDPEVREALKAEMPDIKTTEYMKILNERFKQLTPEQRAPYEQRREEAVARFNAEMAEYTEKYGADAAKIARSAAAKPKKGAAAAASGAATGTTMTWARGLAHLAEHAEVFNETVDGPAMRSFAIFGLIKSLRGNEQPLSDDDFRGKLDKIVATFSKFDETNVGFWQRVSELIVE